MKLILLLLASLYFVSSSTDANMITSLDGYTVISIKQMFVDKRSCANPNIMILERKGIFDVFSDIDKFFSNLWDSMKKGFKSLLKPIINTISDIISGVKKVVGTIISTGVCWVKLIKSIPKLLEKLFNPTNPTGILSTIKKAIYYMTNTNVIYDFMSNVKDFLYKLISTCSPLKEVTEIIKKIYVDLGIKELVAKVNDDWIKTKVDDLIPDTSIWNKLSNHRKFITTAPSVGTDCMKYCLKFNTNQSPERNLFEAINCLNTKENEIGISKMLVNIISNTIKIIRDVKQLATAPVSVELDSIGKYKDVFVDVIVPECPFCTWVSIIDSVLSLVQTGLDYAMIDTQACVLQFQTVGSLKYLNPLYDISECVRYYYSIMDPDVDDVGSCNFD